MGVSLRYWPIGRADFTTVYFAPPASSPPEPVRMRIAVRNPLERESAILLSTINVPEGYLVHLPHVGHRGREGRAAHGSDDHSVSRYRGVPQGASVSLGAH
jgi:hypothetical protein